MGWCQLSAPGRGAVGVRSSAGAPGAGVQGLQGQTWRFQADCHRGAVELRDQRSARGRGGFVLGCILVVRNTLRLRVEPGGHQGCVRRCRARNRDGPCQVWCQRDVRSQWRRCFSLVDGLAGGRELGGLRDSGGRCGDHVLLRFEDERVWISVSDTGIGIPSADLDRIFERFYRVDKGRSRAMGGTGLGLAIVRHVVEAHGERVLVESEVGQGTTFSISLSSS